MSRLSGTLCDCCCDSAQRAPLPDSVLKDHCQRVFGVPAGEVVMRCSWLWLLLESLENARIPFYRGFLPCCCSVKCPLSDLRQLLQPRGGWSNIFEPQLQSHCHAASFVDWGSHTNLHVTEKPHWAFLTGTRCMHLLRCRPL